MKGMSFIGRGSERTQQNQEAKNGHIVEMGKAMSSTKKGTYERFIAIGRCLERSQQIRDGQLADTFQNVKPKQKNKKLITKDKIVLRLIRRYNNGDLTSREYADALVKTLPKTENTSL